MDIKLQFTNKTNEAFLRLAMQSNKAGSIFISRKSEIGKYICSRVRYSNLPVKQSSGTWLDIPYATSKSKDIYYLYFSVEDQKRINDYLEAMFNIFFREVMLEGREKGIKYISVLESYMEGIKLTDDNKIYERLKKFDYRNRKKAFDFIEEMIQLLI